MTHMHILMLGLWQAIALVAVVGACVILFFWWRNNDNDNDDDDGDAPALMVEHEQEPVAQFPFGFHKPQGASA